jgi:hypothetical protein
MTYPEGASILSIVPPDSAIAGVREIKIIGKNFSTHVDSFNNIDSTFVNFGSQTATIKSISSDTITVYRPPTPTSGEMLAVTVKIPSALKIAESNYFLEVPINQFDISAVNARPVITEVDKQENIFLGIARGYIYKMSSDGLTITTFKDTSYLKLKINNVNTDFVLEFTDLKFGPGGFLYAIYKYAPTKNVNPIYCLNTDSATPVIYANLPINSITKMDFNTNGNIYAGKTNQLYLVKTDTSVTPVGDYSGITFIEIRVINGYVYVADSTSLYRSAINPDGTLGNKEGLFNVTTPVNLSPRRISSFNIATDGKIYLSLMSDPKYSVFILENGTIIPFYMESILPFTVDQMIWGNGRYLYLSRGKSLTSTFVRFYRIGMGKNGAPYNGRNL